MRKIIAALIALIFCLNPGLYAQNFKAKTPRIDIEPPGNKLVVGETLLYQVEWLGIPAGRIILVVKGIEKINERDCYHVIGRALPNRFFKKFFDVEYKLDTYIDTKNFYPRRFEKTRRIKNIFTYVIIEFEPERHTATYKFSKPPSGPIEITDVPSLRKEVVFSHASTVDVPQGTQDLLSSLYYFRLLDIKQGNSYSLNVFYHEKNWPINIKIEKPFLQDLYKKGTYPVFEFFPSSELNDFILGRRRIAVCFTTDSARIPLLFTLNTAIGKIRGVLSGLPKK